MVDRIRRIFGGGGSSNEVVVSALGDKDDRVREKSDSTRFILIFNAAGFDKTNIAVNVIDGKRVQIVATRREQIDEKTWSDETIFYEHVLPSDVEPQSLNASWLAQKKKLVITARRIVTKRK